VSHQAASLMAAASDATLSWYSLARNKYCTEYRLDAGDYQGALIIQVDTAMPQGAKLYALGEDGSLAEVAYTRMDESISFSADPGVTYRYVMQYAVNVLAAPLGITLSADRETAYPEDVVRLKVDVPLGVHLNAVKISVNGQESEVGDRFVMPQGEVLVWAEATPETYLVTFLADGEVLEEVQASYGEVVTPPVIPGKSSDNYYSYEPDGWDKEIVPVTGDAIYKARYAMTPVEQVPVEKGVLGTKFKLILGFGIAGIVLVAGAATAVVTIVIVKKKRAKARD
ncbi:MAG: hypothetical protein J5755_00515, partial [Clostridia bacterium]|nr:hypothetical protein [Clostridia bacterium]